MAKTTLDKDLGKVTRLQAATLDISRQAVLPGLSILFLVAVTIFATLVVADGPLAIYAIIGAVVAGAGRRRPGGGDVRPAQRPDAALTLRRPLAGLVGVISSSRSAARFNRSTRPGSPRRAAASGRVIHRRRLWPRSGQRSS